MRKLLLILIAAFCFIFTGCSDFWDWLKDEEDKTYIYTCYAGTMTADYYTNNFTTRTSSQLSSDGYYSKSNSNFADRVTDLKDNFKTVSCVGERMSTIEPKLKEAGFSSARISVVETKARSETEVLYVNIDDYKWIYMKLTNVR